MDTQIWNAALWYWWVLPILLALIFWKSAVRLLGIVIVPDDSIGLVTKKYVLFGAHRELPPGKIIAINTAPIRNPKYPKEPRPHPIFEATMVRPPS